MERQNALHICVTVEKTQLEPLLSLLDEMGENPGSNKVLPFSRVNGVHFARIMVVPGAFTKTGEWLPDTLVLTTNFDGSTKQHIQEIVRIAGAGLDQLFSHCNDYPPPKERNQHAREAFLRVHNTRVASHYVNTRGRSLQQVANEALLYKTLQDYLDQKQDAHTRNPVELHKDICEFVRNSPELEWALTPPPTDFSASLLRWLYLGLAGIAALAVAVLAYNFLTLTLVILLVFIFILRMHELGNLADEYRPPNSRIAMLQKEEGYQTQNQLTSVGFVQGGIFRRVLVTTCLWILEFGNRNIFYRGNLAGVDTIHFARWVKFDSGRRLLFLSNFDGSPESYQDDFIERVAFGLNLVFSNGKGWPKSRFLLFGGASDEQAFRSFYRDRQIRTQVWYAAPPYQGSTAVNIARNAAVREGLSSSWSSRQCGQWLQLL